MCAALAGKNFENNNKYKYILRIVLQMIVRASIPHNPPHNPAKPCTTLCTTPAQPFEEQLFRYNIVHIYIHLEEVRSNVCAIVFALYLFRSE